MVALKQHGRLQDDRAPPGSRNAVVALKPETEEPQRPQQRRSRNAVVALKRDRVTSTKIFSIAKQERRGGIETSIHIFTPQ